MSHMQSSARPQDTDGWQARLKLGYELREMRTVLAENSHIGPLRVQLPLYPEGGVCHTCILHPPGGVVGGDRLMVDVSVKVNAHCLITTPGATKFYRSGGLTATQHQHLCSQGGVIEWFPQDNIIFPGAVAEICTEVHLNDNAKFIGWDITCLGLPTRKETFSIGRLTNRFGLYRNNQPVFLERLNITKPSDLISPSGLRGMPVVATFLATGVDDSSLEELRDLQQSDKTVLAAFTLIDGLLVGRCLGESTFAVRNLFQSAWDIVRPLVLDKAACPPRIWST